jgi:hypothetical protein
MDENRVSPNPKYFRKYQSKQSLTLATWNERQRAIRHWHVWQPRAWQTKWLTLPVKQRHSSSWLVLNINLNEGDEDSMTYVLPTLQPSSHKAQWVVHFLHYAHLSCLIFWKESLGVNEDCHWLLHVFNTWRILKYPVCNLSTGTCNLYSNSFEYRWWNQHGPSVREVENWIFWVILHVKQLPNMPMGKGVGLFVQSTWPFMEDTGIGLKTY